MTEQQTVADRIKDIRRALKLTQKDMATMLGISGPSFSEIENGKYDPNYNFFVNMARKWNVNLYYLLLGEGEMFYDIKNPFSKDLSGFILKDEEVLKFLEYFEKSKIVQLSLSMYFNKLLVIETEAIEKEIAAAKEVEKRNHLENNLKDNTENIPVHREMERTGKREHTNTTKITHKNKNKETITKTTDIEENKDDVKEMRDKAPGKRLKKAGKPKKKKGTTLSTGKQP
jgi:transcriptional regulator with XRE-family HTH domain